MESRIFHSKGLFSPSDHQLKHKVKQTFYHPKKKSSIVGRKQSAITLENVFKSDPMVESGLFMIAEFRRCPAWFVNRR
ncbi:MULTISPECIES: hypothetical protein [Mucilaginibacter]|jgi:hypothetical protein|uniref:hypothetical protein n=1 Tax=Mucilaginibacter TaxID=423349 RepID=UPI001662B0DE|nr:hypothetical protein [Mucilaginibacter rubeus]